MVVLTLTACGGKGTNTTADAITWQEQYDLGVRYLEEGNYEEAIIAFSAAIEIDPKRAEAYIGRGDACVLSGQTEENLAAAQTDYEKAIELDETNVDAYLGLVNVYISQGEYDKARALLQTAAEKGVDDQELTAKIAELESLDQNEEKSDRVEFTGGNYGLLTYDAQGTATAITAYDPEGNQIGYTELTRDEFGNPIKSYRWIVNRTFQFQPTVSEYDGDGKRIKMDIYNADGSIWRAITYEYDGGENPSKEYWYGPGSGYAIAYNDPDGNNIRIEDYDEDGNLIFVNE